MLAPLILCMGTLDTMWAPLIITIKIQNKHYFQTIKSKFNTYCNKLNNECYKKLSVMPFVTVKKHFVSTKYIVAKLIFLLLRLSDMVLFSRDWTICGSFIYTFILYITVITLSIVREGCKIKKRIKFLINRSKSFHR